jgi:hypothetical protein
LKSQQNGKGLKRLKNSASLIILLGSETKDITPVKEKIKKTTSTISTRRRRSLRTRIVRSKMDFFS